MAALPAIQLRDQRRRGYWRSERIFTDGDAYFDGLLADIAAARESVDLETYIFADDELGRRVHAALAAAAVRGVRVRLLLDGFGSGAWIARRERSGESLAVRVFHPLPWLLIARIGRGGPRLAWIIHQALRLNRRDHRKLCLVDGRIAWAGSLNVSADHLASCRGEESWRDTGVRLEGPAVGELAAAFASTWQRSWRLAGERLRPPLLRHRPPPPAPGGLVRLNTRLRQRRRMHRELRLRIAAARRRVWIATAYFVPGPRLVAALARAARGGADVRVLLPAKSDVRFMPWVGASLYAGLLTAGVRVYEYQPRVLHAKTALVDNWLSIGSTNLNQRSLLHDLEVEVVLLDPRSHQRMAEAFLADLACSREVSLDAWQRRPWLLKWAGWSALLLRRWL